MSPLLHTQTSYNLIVLLTRMANILSTQSQDILAVSFRILKVTFNQILTGYFWESSSSLLERICLSMSILTFCKYIHYNSVMNGMWNVCLWHLTLTFRQKQVIDLNCYRKNVVSIITLVRQMNRNLTIEQRSIIPSRETQTESKEES